MFGSNSSTGGSFTPQQQQQQPSGFSLGSNLQQQQQQQGLFSGSNLPQQQNTSPFSAPQQQQSGLGFGSTSQQQSGLGFGSTSQQQSGLGFGSTSQQQSGLGFGSTSQQQSGLGFGFGSTSQQQQNGQGSSYESVGTDGPSNMKWVAASNGHIPEGAVVGGWSSSTQEPYYIARAKSASDGALCPGVVLKSTEVCSFYSSNTGSFNRGGMGQQYLKADTNPNYEVLVVSSDDEGEGKISWVYMNTSKPYSGFGSYNNSTGTIPMSSLRVGYNLQGSPTYIGRAPSRETGDIVPGTLKNNSLIMTENEQIIVNPPLVGFEVLCAPVASDSPKPRIANRYLFNIEYNLGRQTIGQSNKTFGKCDLENMSSLQQKMKPTFKVVYDTKFNWNITSKECEEVEIKGKVPYVFGNKDNCTIHMLNHQSFPSTLNNDGFFPMSFSSNFGGGFPAHALHGGHFNPIIMGGGGGLFGGGGMGAFVMDSEKDDGIFAPTTVTVKDLSKGLQFTKHVGCDSTSFSVPPLSKLTIEQQGQEVNLTVPFKATLKTVYSNDSVEDEEVTGNYMHSLIVALFPSVVGEKLV